MKWTKQLKSVAMISVLTLSLAACNGEVSTVSPQDIIENVVKENKEPFSYYAESTTNLSDGSSIMIKEWKDKTGKSRTEVLDDSGNSSYSVNDGSMAWVYDSESNEVLTINLENYELDSINQSPSEQAKSLLKTIEKTHIIEVVGNEKLLNREVIHVKVTPNSKEATIFNEQELWIDKETWFVLKSSIKFDDSLSTTEYNKFEINPEFEKDLFTFEMPEDAKIVELENISEEKVLKDLNEAAQYIEQPFNYVEEQNDLELNDISVFTMENIPSQLTLNYIKNNIPYFSLVVTPVKDNNKEYNGKDGINVRGQEATVEELGEFRSISWVQDGIGYAVLIDSADVTTEEVLKLLDSMKLFEY